MDFLTILGTAFVCILGFYVFIKGKDNLMQVVEKFVVEAEQKYQGVRNMGKAKLVYVIMRTRAYLPVYFQALISDKQIENFVEKALVILEEYAKYQLNKAEAEKQEKIEVVTDKVADVKIAKKKTKK